MKKILTARQQEILDFITEWTAEKMIAPSLIEMAEHFNVKCSTIAYHIEALKKKGRLTRTSESRSIVLKNRVVLCKSKNCLRQICLRSGADDEPDEANGTIFIHDELLKICNASQFIALRIKDDSMFNLGIHNEDIIVAAPLKYREAWPGDLVVAVTPDGRTLVRSYFPYTSNRIELAPANPDFESETFLNTRNVIRGVVVFVSRTY